MKIINKFFLTIIGVIYILVAFILQLVFFVLYPVKVYGKKNLKYKGGAIVASNHFSNLDIVLLVANFFKNTFSRKLLAKKELAKFKPFGYILAGGGAIFINRGKVDLQAVREVDSQLKKGKKVVMFPEGTRNKTGSTDMQEIKSGVIFFAKKSGCPIIPVRMEKRARIFRRTKIYIGEPYMVGEQGKLSTEEEVQILESKFNNLIPSQN